MAIDGRTAVLGDRLDPTTETLTLEGVSVIVDPEIETHLLYKPVGVVSTARDPEGRLTVVDLVPSDARLYPVGRLDADSEGLILVSNDGELTNLVTHPRYGITKKYLAKVKGRVTSATLRSLVAGVTLDDGPARALETRLVDVGESESLVELLMGEGRNREVRRMMETVGHQVTRLVRTAIGPIADPGLPPGESRRLTHAERRRLIESRTDR